MKKLLFISYYWPPAGGGGVQRAAKFCKYLPAQGWEPLVLTVEGGNAPSIDMSQLADVRHLEHVYRAPTREPHRWYRRLLGGGGAPKRERISQPAARRAAMRRWVGDLIRLNCFIPDTRIGWRAPALRLAREIVETERPALVFTTAPPYTAHLLGSDLKREFGLPWVADFRDPWLEQADYDLPQRMAWARARNDRLERSVLREADTVLCVGHRLRTLLREKVPDRRDEDFVVIPNGYDADDVRAAGPAKDRFVLSHFGTLRGGQLPPALLQALRRLLADPRRAARFLFRLHGEIAPEARFSLEKLLPETCLEIGPILDHDAALDCMYEPQMLLLCIVDVPHCDLILSGKLFDYLPTGNPILGIGPVDGDASEVLRQTGTGQMLDFADADGVYEALLRAWRDWEAGTLQEGSRHVSEYERGRLAKNLAGLLDGLTAAGGRSAKL